MASGCSGPDVWRGGRLPRHWLGIRAFGSLGSGGWIHELRRLNRTGEPDYAWAARLQRKHGALGFPYAVVKKYGDDGGGREAARIRAGFVPRYARVLVMLATLMLGTLAVGTLTVVATALPGEPGVQRGRQCSRRSGPSGRDPSWARRW